MARGDIRRQHKQQTWKIIEERQSMRTRNGVAQAARKNVSTDMTSGVASPRAAKSSRRACRNSKKHEKLKHQKNNMKASEAMTVLAMIK